MIESVRFLACQVVGSETCPAAGRGPPRRTPASSAGPTYLLAWVEFKEKYIEFWASFRSLARTTCPTWTRGAGRDLPTFRIPGRGLPTFRAPGRDLGVLREGALEVLWECSGSALGVLRKCLRAVGMLGECSGNALGELWECSGCECYR